MTALTELWVPILLAAILVFVVSSIIHTLSPWHRNDYPRVPDEDRVMDALRPLAIPPGEYMVPRGHRKEMQSPEFIEKLKKGPVLMLQVLPNGPFAMGKSLAQWFLYSIVVGLFSGYLASRALGPGAEYLDVFRFVGTPAFLGYSVALWQMSIWYQRSWSLTFKATIDGLLYALLTAGVFGWLWPGT